MANKGTTPNKRLPILPGITINSGNWLRLRSFLSELKSQFEKVVENPAAPDQVRSIVLTVMPTGIYLTWRPSDRATSYIVYRAINSILLADAVAIGWVPRADDIAFFDAADQNPDATRWTYWIQAQTGIVVGPISTAVTTTDLTIPSGLPAAHATTHENGGSDEINVAGLSGLLADGQTPLAHNTSHQSGGSDAIKLDDLAAPDNNTDLNVSITAHGLTPVLPNDVTKFLNGTGGYTVPAGTTTVSDAAYSGAWDGDTTVAPSKNAVYDKIQTLLGSSAYTPSNVSSDRSYDANATTIDELADVLGTLIADLQSKGILS